MEEVAAEEAVATEGASNNSATVPAAATSDSTPPPSVPWANPRAKSLRKTVTALAGGLFARGHSRAPPATTLSEEQADGEGTVAAVDAEAAAEAPADTEIVVAEAAIGSSDGVEEPAAAEQPDGAADLPRARPSFTTEAVPVSAEEEAPEEDAAAAVPRKAAEEAPATAAATAAVAVEVQ